MTGAVVLREYQQRLLEAISAEFRRGHRSVLGQLPTGGGKTEIAMEAARLAVARGKRVLFQAHTRVLVDQTSARFAAAGLDHGIIMAGREERDHPLQIGSIMTLVRRLDRVARFDLIVTDECHRATAESYSTILAAWPGSYHIGLSATPQRSDGRGLGGVYEALVCGPSVAELVEMGYLAKFRVFAPSAPDLSGVKTKGGDWEEAGLAAAMDKPVITGCAITHYQRLAAGRQAIAYCCTIAHAESVTRQFKEAGLDAEVLHSKLPPEEQEAVVGRVRAGNLAVLVAIGMVSEGFDVPNVSCAILLRPTKSLVLACQQWGRANRGVAAPDALVLDHAANTERFGLPTTPREWTLKDKKKKPAERSLVKTCKSCFATVPINCSICPECQTPFPLAIPKPPPRAKDGQLVEITSWLHVDRSREGIAAAIRQCRSWRELKALGKHLGFRNGWAYHAARDRGWRPIVNGMGYTTKFVPPRPGYGSGEA
jgi:DNA repair protein RadD